MMPLFYYIALLTDNNDRKTTSILSAFLLCYTVYSQTYEFDYFLEYSYERIDSVSHKVFKSSNYQFINNFKYPHISIYLFYNNYLTYYDVKYRFRS